MKTSRPMAVVALLVAGLLTPAGVALGAVGPIAGESSAAGGTASRTSEAAPSTTDGPVDAPGSPEPTGPTALGTPVAEPTRTSSPTDPPADDPDRATGLAATNQPPVAVSDPPVRVVAGRTVTLAVLANDTDDGLGRPAGQTPHLEVATFSTLGARVSTGPDRTRLRFTARSDDAGRSFTLSYTVTDGSLVSDPATVPLTVTAAPVVRQVSLHAPTLVALRTSLLRGSVRPLAPGPVTVRVQHRIRNRWTAWRSGRVDARGRYAVRFRTDRPQRVAFRAVATWGNGSRATSGRISRTVLARPDVRVSGPLTRADVPYSYRTGCPVRPSGLRRISMNRFTYRRVVARGSLVVSASAVPELVRVFRASFRARFPVRSMKPSDAFYARGRRTPTQSDLAAMRADNTSAFNCRPVTGNPYRVSQHSYGNAIDINTVRNPYVVGTRVYPAFARTYLDRSWARTGMILRDGVIATSMRRNGWPWGARWSHPDYQHFSANGG